MNVIGALFLSLTALLSGGCPLLGLLLGGSDLAAFWVPGFIVAGLCLLLGIRVQTRSMLAPSPPRPPPDKDAP